MVVQKVVPFGKIWVWALGPVEQSLFKLCMGDKICGVTEGRMEPPYVFALFGVGIAGCGPP